MKRVLVLFLLGVGCTTLAPTSVPERDTSNKHLLDVTAAIVDDGEVVCAGTWLSQTELLTAAHCVKDDEGTTRETVEVAFREDVPREQGAHPEKMFLGSVQKANDELDLAIVVASVPPHSVAVLAEENSPLGQHLRIVGHPVGLVWTYMEGVSNGLRRVQDRTVMQVIAPIFFGNSGGGAFNEQGELVGVCSFILRAPEQSFFVPVSAVRAFLK